MAKGEDNMEFVICDDEKLFRNKIHKVIDKIYMNNDEYYHVTEFTNFNNSFLKLIKDGSPKIYILDIEMKDDVSGIDIARKIRNNDWESIIIFITSHNELGYQALKAQIMLLDFISKYDDYERNLELVIKKAISMINSQKTMTFNSDGISYVIHLNDILYVVKDTIDRKCIIKTTYTEIEVNRSLNYFVDNLDKRFYMSHRSCIVNTERIDKVDWKNNIIYFNNGDSIDLISRDKKRGFKEYVGS